MADRNILLVEPGYLNKYPPIGLMKIATYHRMLGDNVTFYKGDLKEMVLRGIVSDCINKLNKLNKSTNWKEREASIAKYIKTGKKKLLEEKLLFDIGNDSIAELWLNHFRLFYYQKEYSKSPVYDRIYVTTLFTFYWNITIKTIQDAKLLVKDVSELKVGGVLASLLADEVREATDIVTMQGLLDKPRILDDNEIIIDDLPLDYSILDEIDYEYPTGSAYFTFMTKGCTRTCAFCSVPKLEPTYKDKIPTNDKFQVVNEKYGEQQHLLLMDNNVLASPKFPEIIEEIKQMGFKKGATYIEPNQLDKAVENLKKGINDKAYTRRSYNLLNDFRKKRLKSTDAENLLKTLEKFQLLNIDTATKDNIVKAYEEIKAIYELNRDKNPKKRYVDFNQGTDARYVTDEYMQLLSEIPINPLRIAFDYIGLKKIYIAAVELAAKHGIDRLSNYLLFNFNDKPEDLYERIKINIELSEKFDIHIYSFPMKYIPLFGEEAKDRKYVGKFWKKKFIRAIQSISNATRGIVPSGRSFFEKAFGKNLEEYFELLYMPENYLIYRKLFENDLEYTKEWKYLFSEKNLSFEEKNEAINIIEENDFTNLDEKTNNKKIRELLLHYTITTNEIENTDTEYLSIKQKYDHLIKNDKFVDLTLTYDYERRINEDTNLITYKEAFFDFGDASEVGI